MSKGRSPFHHTAIAFVAGLVISSLLSVSGLLETFNNQLFDSFTRLRNQHFVAEVPSLSQQISVVAISNSDVTKLNRPFPWPRDEQSVIFEKLADRSPSVVAVDLLYPEPSTVEADSRLAFQLAANEKVTTAFYFDDEEPRAPRDQSDLLERSGNRMAADFDSGDWKTYTSVPALPHPSIAAGVTRVGHAHSDPDADGIIRSVPLVIRDQKRLYPSLALQAALLHWDIEWSQIHLNEDSLSIVGVPEIGKLEIPVDSAGRMTLNYLPKAQTAFPAMNVFSLMEAGEDETISLTDRVVFVGSLVTGHGDIYATPVDPLMPGLLINALAAEQIFSQSFIEKTPSALSVVFALFVTAITALLFWFGRPVFGGLVWLVFLFGMVAGVFLLFTKNQIWLPPSFAIISSIATAGVMSISYHLFVARRHSQTISAFSRYIGPNLGTILSENPEAFEGGPKRKLLTIFFSDIVAYTATSESLESEELIGMLNRYFDRMAEVAFRFDATVSKYMGDGMMVFFNEPIDQEDHAVRAIRMALSMQEAIPELNEEFEKEGLPPLSVRMGINTGYAHVGNVGSAGFTDFTVIGPSVNLAARVMDQGGAGDILVSTKTRTLAQDHFEFEEVGNRELKGVRKPELIYRVVPKS